jgi:hypothetical protein
MSATNYTNYWEKTFTLNQTEDMVECEVVYSRPMRYTLGENNSAPKVLDSYGVPAQQAVWSYNGQTKIKFPDGSTVIFPHSPACFPGAPMLGYYAMVDEFFIDRETVLATKTSVLVEKQEIDFKEQEILALRSKERRL